MSSASTPSQWYTWLATTTSGANCVWLLCVPNHSTPLSLATPMAPTVICAVPVSTVAPPSMNDVAASEASAVSLKESV